MGRRGPAPTPTKIKRQQGETRPGQLNYDEPQPRLAPPKMPPDMNSAAKRVWRRVLADMPKDVIVAADADVLRCYCEAVARYAQAQSIYERSGVLLNRGGDLVKNPLHQVVRDNSESIRLFARELGLSPSARAGLHVADARGAMTIDDDLGPPPRLRVMTGGTYG
jgi:P27 family predicted phage terminase small subunit